MTVVRKGRSKPSKVQTRKARQTWRRDYDTYLASPAWAEFRRGWFERHPRTGCYLCGTRQRLQLHHLRYDRVGQERDSDVRAMCSSCHEKIHAYARRQRMTVYNATMLLRARARMA